MFPKRKLEESRSGSESQKEEEEEEGAKEEQAQRNKRPRVESRGTATSPGGLKPFIKSFH